VTGSAPRKLDNMTTKPGLSEVQYELDIQTLWLNYYAKKAQPMSLNISIEFTLMQIMDMLKGGVDKELNDPLGTHDSGFIENICGETLSPTQFRSLTELERDKIIADYLIDGFYNDPKLKESRSAFKAAMVNAQNSGVNVVVASGNSLLLSPRYTQVFSNYDYMTNLLGVGALVVAEVDDNQTILDATDDRLGNNSLPVSRNFRERDNTSLLAARGYYFKDRKPLTGSSLSSPLVAALMNWQQLHHDDSYQGRLDCLKLACLNKTCVSDELEGFGILDFKAFILGHQ
jgi:hypothetical protein